MLPGALRARFRVVSPLAVIAIAILSLASTAAAQTNVTWIGGTGNWNSASNWSPAVIPNNSGGNLFNVFIDGGNAASSHVTYDLLSGTVFDLTIDSSDSLTIAQGSHLQLFNNLFASGTVFITSGAQLAASGIFQSGSVLNNSGSFASTGSITFSGTVNNAGGMINGGTISSSGVFHNTGQVNPNTGHLDIHGFFHNHNGGVVLALDAPLLNGTGTVLNAGSFTLGRTSMLIGSFLNEPSGLLDIHAGGSLVATNPFQNNGVVSITGEGSMLFAPSLTNGGNIYIFGGFPGISASVTTTTYIQTAGSTEVDGVLQATIVAMQGGTLSGHGTIIGDVTLMGQLNPGNLGPNFISGTGFLTINGNYAQMASGTFTAELGGVFAGIPADGAFGGAQYDQLIVSGDACLQGILNIVLVSNFMPQLGDSFTIAQFGSLSCTFSGFNGLNFAPGLFFDVQYNPNDVTLLVSRTPEPGTLLLVASGLSGIFWKRRRRQHRRH